MPVRVTDGSTMPPMRYTLWLDGHLLGETRLEHRNAGGRQRLGVLHATPYGAEVVPGLCGFLGAASAVKECMLRNGIRDPEADVEQAMRLLETTPEGAHFTRVVSTLGRLELRQAGGERAAFHTVIVTDVSELQTLRPAEQFPSGGTPRFLISATPLDIGAIASQMRARAARRARLEPN